MVNILLRYSIILDEVRLIEAFPINGSIIMEHFGIKKGLMIGKIKNFCYEMFLDDINLDKNELLSMAKSEFLL